MLPKLTLFINVVRIRFIKEIFIPVQNISFKMHETSI